MLRRMPGLRRFAAALSFVALTLAACAPADDDPSATPSSSSAAADDCSPASLRTLTPGTLTFGTDDPVYPPWFADNKPENGQGFEGAVAAALARQLGYEPARVAWVRVPFNAAIAPGPKAYDVDINEFSITEERRRAVDFSSPYYDVSQAVIALKSSRLAGATTLAALKDAKLGAQVGTTSYRAITEVVRPTAQPQVYNNNDDAKKALENKQIDGLVVDLPTAFFITSAEIQDAAIVGQLPQPAGTPEQFGLVLDKGSPLTACVSRAVDQLRDAGTLKALEQQWLAQTAGAPVLS